MQNQKNKNFKSLVIISVLAIVIIMLVACSDEEGKLEEGQNILSTQTFEEIDIKALAKLLIPNADEICMNTFNGVIDEEGHLDSFNLVYIEKAKSAEKTLMYRKDASILKIVDTTSENSVGYGSANVDTLDKLSDKRIIEAVSGYDAWAIYFNEHTGVMVYGLPMEKGDSPQFIE